MNSPFNRWTRRRRYFLFAGLGFLFAAFALKTMDMDAGTNGKVLFYSLLFAGIGLKGIFLILVLLEKGLKKILPGLLLILAGVATLPLSRHWKASAPTPALILLILAITLKISGISLLLFSSRAKSSRETSTTSTPQNSIH